MVLTALVGGALVLLALALYLDLRRNRPPEVIGTAMSDEWMRHVTRLLTKPGAGEGTYIEG